MTRPAGPRSFPPKPPMLAALGLALALAAAPAAAQQKQKPLTPEEIAERAAEKATRALELEETQRVLQGSGEARARLDAEVAELRGDRARLNAALIDTTGRLRSTEARISAIEQRLATFGMTEQAIKSSLEGRRGVVVEVLAALQRMGRSPPPAVLVRPEDMLEAVRASMLLGTVLPELRSETEALASDLSELVRLKTAAAAERDTLGREVAALVDDRRRVEALVEARQADLARAEAVARQEADRAAELAARAQTLKDLISRLESSIDASSRAAEEARRAEAESKTAEAEAKARDTREKIAALAFRDPARLAPKIAFSEAKGLLPLPVSGVLVKAFNAVDATGGTLKGHAYATRAGAVVSAPCDGWVAFAGPFRSYGQLLIINAGGGYYLLLAGMDRINVGVGQFVLAGEPVAVMGEASQATAASVGSDTNQPVLYVEFRKDGVSIDPAPWWAASTNEKVRG
ncbi:peptidoglycan DD-metalloendopeptidase family protein [Alsobacter sp. SYSU M60028]|uniref:Peptidoglycan DD-metalloendopeptidase family protein n=1 Tax=Alsobacter ponti TaxID=2962936 RepID=A0ABT1LGR3_9HYPH|nr:peptidoglycan DD-metalloendopeptidase family protein [Alsobacter ponti]MCP8940695.1 peptidoglycan DD-metalloendopeptidase family protein [Alsobacter ponti]